MQNQNLANDNPPPMAFSNAKGTVDRTLTIPEQLERKGRALLVSEVAGLLRVSTRQVYKLASDGDIPSLKIAGCIRFDGSVLATWLRENSGGAK